MRNARTWLKRVMAAGAVVLLGPTVAPAQAPASTPFGGAYAHEQRIAVLEAQMAALAPVLELVQAGRLEVVTNDKGVTFLRLTGINLQIVNGRPDDFRIANGTCNVIIGYDPERTGGAPSCSDGMQPDEEACLASGGTWAV